MKCVLYRCATTAARQIQSWEATSDQLYLHPAGGHHVPDVRHHHFREDLVDETVVADEAVVRQMLHAEAVIWKQQSRQA